MRLLRRHRAWLAFGLLVVAALALIARARTNSAAATVTIEWNTASELNTAGFNLYRGESKDGPFTRINPELIPASADPLAGGSYVFTDTGVIAGRAYYYQLEDVEVGGATNRHDPYEVKAADDFTAPIVVLVAAMIIVGLIGLIGQKRPTHA